MLVYTVTKPVGTKDKEFEAYTRLLEEVGIDVSDSPRVPEPGTDRRWLYAWRKKIEADRFAAELRRRTGDGGWVVYQFEGLPEERGPVAPLEIASIPEQGGYRYYLTPASRERVVAAYPGTKLPTGFDLKTDVQQHFMLRRDEESWMEIVRFLTGRNDHEVELLGGVRVIVSDGAVAFDRIPIAAQHC